MAFAFGLAKHPQTSESLLMVGVTPEPWPTPNVLQLLRTI